MSDESTITEVVVTLNLPGVTEETVVAIMDEMGDWAALHDELLDWAVSASETDSVVEFELTYAMDNVVVAEDRALDAIRVVLAAAHQGSAIVTKRTGDLVHA